MKLFDARQTAALLPYPELAQSIAEVLQQQDQVTAPERLVVGLAGGGSLLLMPASDPRITVTKLVTVHPQQRPSIRAEVWVMDTQSGERLALLDGAVVTARRTAAVSLLAAQKLATQPEGSLLVVGAGAQGRSHLEALRAGLGTRQAFIYSRSPESAQALAEYAQRLGMQAEAVGDLEAALEQATLIVTATTSTAPLLHRARPDAFIAAVGAYKPSMVEVAPELVHQSRLYADTLAGARHEAGDYLQAGIDWDQVTGLDAALEAPRPGGRVLFKSVGHALWDLAAARLAVSG
ncbi:MAG: delta(1)-pyrroline-2-carboxylate reductase family protein [Meiothermus sp.]|nr:delta(1)-pyrroline-2-carboxylate reductase family protein [Meiothermus sp.]